MTNPTQHGQVPEALRLAVSSSAMADEGEMIHLLSWHEIRNLLRADATELRRQHARIAELEAQIEALSGVQALSAAPVEVADALADSQYLAGVSAGWNAANADDPNAALQKLHESRAGYLQPLRAARAPSEQQADPKAAPTRTALPEGWTDCTIEFGNDGPEVVAYGPKRMMTRLAKWLGKYFAQVIAEAAPKAAPGEQNTVPAEWLEQAYREGWAACRDAETIGEEAEDWAFGNSTANSRMIDAQQAAPQQEAQEPVAWESTTPGYIKYITQARYEKFSPKVQRWYKPYKCSSCAAPQPAPDCHHRPPCDECAALAAQGGK